MDQNEVAEYLHEGAWRRSFDSGALARGLKISRARQVQGVSAEILDTGDVEMTGKVFDKDGGAHEAVIVLWLEGDTIAF